MSTNTEEQTRAEIVEIGRRLYGRAYIASNDGNISVRLDADRIVATPRGVSKGFMTADMMVVVDADGTKVAGEREASTELPMHLEIYRQRADVQAVVHAHPPLATGFAVAGIPLTRAVLAEVVTTLGSIPIATYGTPSTSELPAAVRKYVKAHDGMLLANHGAVTCGNTLLSAYYKMETIEHFAKISLVARLLGREHLLSREEVGRLNEIRTTYGTTATAPFCDDPPAAAGAPAPAPGVDAQALCQVLEAATGAPGERLVPDAPAGRRAPSRDGEIRLTYGELTDLVADAIRHLRG